MASTESYVSNQLYQVPLTERQPDPDQPRHYLDPQALDELAASIAQHSILGSILFRQDAVPFFRKTAMQRHQHPAEIRHAK